MALLKVGAAEELVLVKPMHADNVAGMDQLSRLVLASMLHLLRAKNIPTAALASLWLQERLQQERLDICTSPNTYRYPALHPRRADATVYRHDPAPTSTDEDEEEVIASNS